jgi:hypothetical protein
MQEIIIKFSETSNPDRITDILGLVRQTILLKIAEDSRQLLLERLKQISGDKHLASQEPRTQISKKCSKLVFDFRQENENYRNGHSHQTEIEDFGKLHEPILLVQEFDVRNEDVP